MNQLQPDQFDYVLYGTGVIEGSVSASIGTIYIILESNTESNFYVKWKTMEGIPISSSLKVAGFRLYKILTNDQL